MRKMFLVASVLSFGMAFSAAATPARIVNLNQQETPASVSLRAGAGRTAESAPALHWTPIEFGFFTPVALPWGYDYDVRGVRLGLFYSDNPSLEGVDFGIVGNVQNHMNGLQACIINLCQGNGMGIQGGVVDYVNGEFSGWQAGVVEYARSGRGFQCGFYNGAENFTGVQLGVMNVTRRMYGMQIGLVNIISDNDVPFLPLFNCYF